MNLKRPRIGITMRIDLETNRFYLARHYSEAIEAAGGLPVHLSLIPKSSYISAVVDYLDGVLLPGSDSDVDPLRYGRDPHPALGSVHQIRDETDLLILKEVDNRRLPFFGICFGLQVLNVFRGGTLIQDIRSQTEDAVQHQQHEPRARPSHKVRLLPGSRLSSLADSNDLVVNSHHHQAIDTIGNNLLATSWAYDGLVEAVEDPRSDRFVLAVQWHPELGWEEDLFSKKLFKYFVDAALARTDG